MLFFPLGFFNLNFTPYLQSTLLIDRVWSPSIFHLDRTSYIFQSSQKRQNFILYTYILWNQGFCSVFAAFFLSTEGRRKDPEEFWSAPGVGRLTNDDEEALASQQETQMIFFIQQVSSLRRCSLWLVTQFPSLFHVGSSYKPLLDVYAIVKQAFLHLKERLRYKWEFVLS